MEGRAFTTNEPLTLSSFPSYDPAKKAPLNDNDNILSRQFHPQLYNPLRNSGSSLTLSGLDMHRLIERYTDRAGEFRNTTLYRLLPTNLNSSGGASLRHMITMSSADVGRPVQWQTSCRLVGRTLTRSRAP